MMFLYAIKHTESNRAYLGSTINLRERELTHLRMLRRGNHHCQHLQNAWNKYGEANFAIVQVGKADSLQEARELEQAFLECFWGESLYNAKCCATGMPSGDSHPAKRADWHQKHIMTTLTAEERKQRFGGAKGWKRDPVVYAAGAKKQWADPTAKQNRMLAMRGKRAIVECPHCQKTGGGGNMRRYHFDNCKTK
jgi:group I intron endonuclease